MKISTISDRKGNLIAVLGGGESTKFRVRMRAHEDQLLHEVDLPDEADSLKPHEIVRRLKVPSPGQAPVFSKE